VTRVSKLALGSFLVVFVLACNIGVQPMNDAQETVEMVQSLATALPVETVQSIPSALPDIETPVDMPDISDVTNPQGEPLTEWNGIPIMPAVTSGEEAVDFYSFKADATVTEAVDYYKTELENLGWTEFFSVPDTGSGALLTYDKDELLITVTITPNEDGVLVLLTYQ